MIATAERLGITSVATVDRRHFTVVRLLDRWALSYSEPGRMAGVRAIHDNADLMAFLSFRSGPLDHDHRDVNRKPSCDSSSRVVVG